MLKRIRSIVRRIFDKIADFVLAAPVVTVIVIALLFSVIWIVTVLAVQFVVMFACDAALFPYRYAKGFVQARRTGELVPQAA